MNSRRKPYVLVMTNCLKPFSVIGITLCVLAGLITGFEGTVYSAGTPAGTAKVGFVDFDRIIKDSLTGKAALEDVKSFHATRQAEITSKEQAIVDMQKDYDQKKYTLSKEAREKREYEIEEKKLELKRFVQDSEREMDKRQKQNLEPINEVIFTYIKKYGDMHGYAIIFEKSTVLYTNPAYDLTADIIKLIDSEKSGSKPEATSQQ